jgi:hypothetical protein
MREDELMVESQSEARRFFIDKIVHQARTENATLSDDERQMLMWSETAPDSVSDPELAQRLATVISDADYESKIAGLLSAAFRREVRADSDAKAAWRQAWSVLKRGDHYILIMIDQAVGKQLKPRWQFW